MKTFIDYYNESLSWVENTKTQEYNESIDPNLLTLGLSIIKASAIGVIMGKTFGAFASGQIQDAWDKWKQERENKSEAKKIEKQLEPIASQIKVIIDQIKQEKNITKSRILKNQLINLIKKSGIEKTYRTSGFAKYLRDTGVNGLTSTKAYQEF